MVTCHVRMARISATEGFDIDVLEPSERVRMMQFIKPADRLQFATGRHLARQLAAEMMQLMPTEILIRTRCIHCGSPLHGKPFAVHSAGTLPLSIAHSAGWVLVAATNGPDVGADIEMINEARHEEHLLEQIEERHRGPRDAAAFTRLWVHKEAVLKCTGHGLMLSPRSFSIDFSCNPPSVIVGSAHFATPICLATLDAPAGYVAALAVAGTQKFTVEVCRQGRATKDSCAFDIDLPAECRGESSGPGRTIDGNLMASPGNREPHRPIGHSGPLCAEPKLK
jgi:4'-phosphopantetheinyl transferase